MTQPDKTVRYFTIDNRADGMHEVALSHLKFERDVYSCSGLGQNDLLGHLRRGNAGHIAAALGRRHEALGTA